MVVMRGLNTADVSGSILSGGSKTFSADQLVPPS